eukprot:4699028-Prymnesium_polylepis.1
MRLECAHNRVTGNTRLSSYKQTPAQHPTLVSPHFSHGCFLKIDFETGPDDPTTRIESGLLGAEEDAAGDGASRGTRSREPCPNLVIDPLPGALLVGPVSLLLRRAFSARSFAASCTASAYMYRRSSRLMMRS